MPLAMSHGADRNRDGAVATVGKFRNRDAQFAFDEARARLRGIARASEPDDAREAAVAALDKMKAGLAPRPARRFFTGDQHRIALADDAHGRRIDAREIDGDLERVVGLVDVQRRRALAGERLRGERASELEKDLPRLSREVPDFR